MFPHSENRNDSMKLLCCGCNVEKDEAEFSKSSKALSGRQSRCKTCFVVYYHRNREACRKKENERRRHDPYAVRYRNLKSSAKRRGHAFTLTLSQLTELLQTRTCPICSVDLLPVMSEGSVNADNLATIDRLDPTAGYTVQNAVLICYRCNRIKQDATPAELRRVADFIESVQSSRMISDGI